MAIIKGAKATLLTMTNNERCLSKPFERIEHLDCFIQPVFVRSKHPYDRFAKYTIVHKFLLAN